MMYNSKEMRIFDKKSKEKRFKRLYPNGPTDGCDIWIDSVSGINYFRLTDIPAGGLCVLLDKDGKPVVTPLEERESLLKD